MRFKRFTLDSFQEDAINAIEQHRSVVVSAAIGTGKTLIADYVIDKYLKANRKIIYTAPIKALSNQNLHCDSIALQTVHNLLLYRSFHGPSILSRPVCPSVRFLSCYALVLLLRTGISRQMIEIVFFNR